MDLQIKLVNDGYAAQYAFPPEAEGMPPWAVWRNEAYGVTAEPVAFAYNRNLLSPALVPRTHAALARTLAERAEALHGKVVAYDPERSGVGFLLLTQDLEVTPRTWDVRRRARPGGVKLYTTTETMLDRLAAGEAVLAFDVFGAYALERAKADRRSGSCCRRTTRCWRPALPSSRSRLGTPNRRGSSWITCSPRKASPGWRRGPSPPRAPARAAPMTRSRTPRPCAPSRSARNC